MSDDEWDRHRIKAEVERRGHSLSDVARNAGLSESSCRVALKGGSFRGAVALSDFLGIPVSVLFPGQYVRSLVKLEAKRKRSPRSRPKRSASSDTVRVTA